MGMTRRHPATASALKVSNNASTGDAGVDGLWLVLIACSVKRGGGVPAVGALVPRCWLVLVVEGLVVEGANA